MKQYLTLKEADALLEKYYDGLTTGAEEEQLQEFLQQDDLPEKYEAERALFGYFAQEKQLGSTSRDVRFDIDAPMVIEDLGGKKKIPPRNLFLRLNPVLRWSLAAAALLFAVFILDNRIQAQNNDVAYVDGIRCTDSQQVKALAIASIDQMDLGSDEVSGTVENMTDDNLVESQLQLFPEIK